MTMLDAFGIDTVIDRIVIDRNRIKGGGVTIAINLRLILLAKMHSNAAANCAHLMIDSDPQPPLWHRASRRLLVLRAFYRQWRQPYAA